MPALAARQHSAGGRHPYCAFFSMITGGAAIAFGQGMTTTMVLNCVDEEDVRWRALDDGFEQLDDRTLLGVVIGKGARGQSPLLLADLVLRELGGFEALAVHGAEAFAELPGIGTARALRLAATVEVSRRMARRRASPREPLATPPAVAAYLTPRLGALEHEEMWVLALDGNNGLVGVRRVAHGGAHSILVEPAELLRAALRIGGCSFLLAHNHPSGCPEPSAEDVATTRSVARAAKVAGLTLVDHVVVTRSGAFTSLAERGVLGTSFD
ncbi:MAG: DNA repair protein RadC [Myxococcales bacterium]|nr:DNA repair protein RadC [Myxococcales bacterium]